jgi:hypothetical protein
MNEFLNPTQHGHDDRTGTVFVFLSLFLLVLAFFIVLVAISTIEKAKSKAVMNSLSSTFTTYQPEGTKPTDFTAKEGDVLGRQAFQEEITGIFATTLQVAKVEVVKPGRLMRAQMPSSAMFEANEARIKQNALAFLDRTVAALGGRPPGLRFDLEFVIGAPTGSDKLLAVGENLEMARAGAFAREMISRGAPPDSVAIGLTPGDPEKITLRFYVRRHDGALPVQPRAGPQ